MLVLKADLECQDSDGIKIRPSNYTLDCNGYSVRFIGDADTNSDGIIVDISQGFTLIKNCVVEGFEDGIIVIDGARATIENCTSSYNSGSGLRVSDGVVSVKDSEFNNNGGTGVLLTLSQGTFSNVVANNNGEANIELSEDASARFDSVEACFAEGEADIMNGGVIEEESTDVTCDVDVSFLCDHAC